MATHRAPRSRIQETVAVFLGKDPDKIKYFHHTLQIAVEEEDGALDFCVVCLEPLDGYEDGTCVKCSNISTCRGCVQTFNPAQLVPQPPDQDMNRFMWNEQLMVLDEGPIVADDHVCLQCGIYSPTEKQAQAYYLFHANRSTLDALLGRMYPYGRLRVAFAGWNLFRRKRRLLLHAENREFQISGGPGGRWCARDVADFLTLAEEGRLVVAAGRSFDALIQFLCRDVPSGRQQGAPSAFPAIDAL